MDISFSSTSSGSSSDEEDLEDKKLVRVDSCILCAETGIAYDPDGNVMKREPFSDSEEEQALKFSKEQLLTFLCRCLGLQEEWRQNSYSQLLLLDHFPFCQPCETLLNSLAEMYRKLDELGKVLKGKVKAAEQVYWRDNLYDTHPKSYLQFRTDALERAIYRKERKKTWVNSGTKIGRLKSCGIPKTEDDVCLKEDRVGVPMSPSSEMEGRGSQKVIMLSPTMSRVLRKRTSQQTSYAQVSSEEKEEEEIVPISKTKSKHMIISPACEPDQVPAPVANSRIKRKCEVKGISNRVEKPHLDSEIKKASRKKSSSSAPVSLNKSVVTRKTLVTTSKNVEDEAKRHRIRTEHRRSGLVVRDPTTGNITYTAGFGNRHGSFKGNLQFRLVLGDDGNKGYQCTTCYVKPNTPAFSSSLIKMHASNRRQRLLFREHYVGFHSNRNKCRLCTDESAGFSTREELLQHLATFHSIDNVKRYHYMIGWRNKTTLGYMRGKKTCEICGMPNLGSKEKPYQQHLMRHMSEEEKKKVLLIGGRRYKEILNPTPSQLESGVVSQCQHCGKFITHGDKGMRAHHQETHPELSNQNNKRTQEKLPFLCSFCGKRMSSNQELERHLGTVHPDGKNDSLFKCKFPGCGEEESVSDELSLKAHIVKEHGGSEEASLGLLCGICGRVLASSWALKQHRLVHSGEKPYKCHICQKSFPLKSTLKLHLATNHCVGAKVLKCEKEGCDQLFPNPVYFRVHMRHAHGIFVKQRKGRRGGGIIGSSLTSTLRQQQAQVDTREAAEDNQSIP